jgi:type VI secretion system protein ImpA
MAELDLAALTGPLSEEDPCGPDLDAAGDLDYMNFVATAENLLPASFFDMDGKPFDRSKIDFAAVLAAMRPPLERTRDVRLFVLLAKFSVLNRDLALFETAVRAIQEMVSRCWDEIHPRGEDGIFGARTAALETLDDMPVVIIPLQYVPLVHHRRLGAITYRQYMVAHGEIAARKGDESHDLTTLENAVAEVELPHLVETLGRFDSLRKALAEIRKLCVERAGIEQAPKLERLPALVDKICALLNGIVVQRDPAAALAQEAASEGTEPTAAAMAGGELRSLAQVADSLASVADYFARHEPSNPALLLVRQGQQLMGKSFIEVMKILVPGKQVEQAAIAIGAEQTLHLPIARLSELAASSSEQRSAEANGGAPSAPRIEVTTRADALRLLEQVGAYYRIAEPSSPLPYLTDRARDLAGRDFLSLLKHVLPAGEPRNKNS